MNRSSKHQDRRAVRAMAPRRCAVTVGLVLGSAMAPLPAAALGHFECTVVETVRQPTERVDHADYLTHYTCRVTDGLLEGFVISASTRWEAAGKEGKLLASLGFGRKGDATIVYEATQGAVPNLENTPDAAVGWESTAVATVKAATGAAAHLSGKSFTLQGRATGPGRFSMKAVLSH